MNDLIFATQRLSCFPNWMEYTLMLLNILAEERWNLFLLNFIRFSFYCQNYKVFHTKPQKIGWRNSKVSFLNRFFFFNFVNLDSFCTDLVLGTITLWIQFLPSPPPKESKDLSRLHILWICHLIHQLLPPIKRISNDCYQKNFCGAWVIMI